MKNNKKKNGSKMNFPETVTATIDAVPFLEGLVKYLARSRNSVSHLVEFTHPGWEAIDISVVETFVGGQMVIRDHTEEPVKIPFGSSFVFTCIRGYEGEFELKWSSSLS